MALRPILSPDVWRFLDCRLTPAERASFADRLREVCKAPMMGTETT